MNRFGLLIAFCFGTAQALSSQQVPLASPDAITPLTKLLRFSEEHRIAVGLVLGRSRRLCTPVPLSKNLSVDPASNMQLILAGTGYVAVKHDDSYVVHEDEVLEQEKLILNHRLTKFGSPPGPMSLIGETLQGFIQVELEGEKGFFIHHMSDTAEQQLAFKTVSNTSVEEIANQLISMDGKGIWELSLTKSMSANGKPRSVFKVFGYEANRDEIRNINCSQSWTD